LLARGQLRIAAGIAARSIQAQHADADVVAAADCDLAGFQGDHVAVVAGADLEVPFEERDRRAVFLRGDVELRSLDDRDQVRGFDAQTRAGALADAVEGVAADLNDALDQAVLRSALGNFQFGVACSGESARSLTELDCAVGAGAHSRGQLQDRAR
jgi:hypothetical protein